MLAAANRYLNEKPITITAAHCPRSAGGPHDFYSEGDYWWPDPKNANAPYIRRDGMSNPANFTAHRQYLMRFSVQAPALVSAWRITRERRYADHAMLHFRAWLIDAATRMNPNLQYAQAIHGRVTGRGTGIIDTIHLVEVARAIQVLAQSPVFPMADFAPVKQWFADYVKWMTTHPYGITERDAKNNHGTCWVMQVAQFAALTENRQLTSYCRERYEAVLVPGQMAPNGSFPLEMKRTKPYGYSLFNLEAMAATCEIGSVSEDDLWKFTLPDGRGIRKAVAFLEPYIRYKKRWPLPPDVMYFGDWPMRQSSLLFAGLAYRLPGYISLWKTLPADSRVEEVIRNFFIRQPVLWVSAADGNSAAR